MFLTRYPSPFILRFSSIVMSLGELFTTVYVFAELPWMGGWVDGWMKWHQIPSFVKPVHNEPSFQARNTKFFKETRIVSLVRCVLASLNERRME